MVTRPTSESLWAGQVTLKLETESGDAVGLFSRTSNQLCSWKKPDISENARIFSIL